jgi:hypothetical protein
MPATVIFKEGFPNLTSPVETSASIGSDGLVTGSAVFLVGPAASALQTSQLIVGASISPLLFSGLRSVVLQGLFIENRNLEKRNCLTFLRLGVVGAVNPPIVERRREVSSRGFSKSEVIKGQNVIFSFNYQAESHAATTVVTKGQAYQLTVPTPISVNQFNVVGKGAFTQYGGIAGAIRPLFGALNTGGISVTGRVLITESSEDRVGITRLTKTSEFVYE